VVSSVHVFRLKLYIILSSPPAHFMPLKCSSASLDRYNIIWFNVQIMKLLTMQDGFSFCPLRCFSTKKFSSALCFEATSICYWTAYRTRRHTEYSRNLFLSTCRVNFAILKTVSHKIILKSSSRKKRPGRKSEVQYAWIYTSTPRYVSGRGAWLST
jgi:hypothetical protein